MVFYPVDINTDAPQEVIFSCFKLTRLSSLLKHTGILAQIGKMTWIHEVTGGSGQPGEKSKLVARLASPDELKDFEEVVHIVTATLSFTQLQSILHHTAEWQYNLVFNNCRDHCLHFMNNVLPEFQLTAHSNAVQFMENIQTKDVLVGFGLVGAVTALAGLVYFLWPESEKKKAKENKKHIKEEL